MFGAQYFHSMTQLNLKTAQTNWKDDKHCGSFINHFSCHCTLVYFATFLSGGVTIADNIQVVESGKVKLVLEIDRFIKDKAWITGHEPNF